MRRLNFIGAIVVKLRHQRGWTQKKLHTMLELAGCVITRQTLANIEIGRAPVCEERIIFLGDGIWRRGGGIIPGTLAGWQEDKTAGKTVCHPPVAL